MAAPVFPQPSDRILAALSNLRERRERFLAVLREWAASARPRVLIADDNATYAMLLREALRVRGVDADLARDEGEARMLIARASRADCPYALVVVDGVCSCDRGQGTCEGLPALFVSGAGEEGARVDVCKSEGIDRIADEVAARVL